MEEECQSYQLKTIQTKDICRLGTLNHLPQDGLSGSLLLLPGFGADWCCYNLHLLKNPLLERPGQRRSTDSFSCMIPECLWTAIVRLLHYHFHTWNHTFVILHLILQGIVYAKYTWEIFCLCQELEFSLYYLFLPYLLLVVNLFCLFVFALSCVTNPGTITKANELLFLQVYEFDEVMFPKNVKRSTCDLRKPA